MDKSNYQKTKGLTLIGVLVALGILAAAAVSISRTYIARKDIVGSSRDRLIAVSLGREGLELVRALRDDNWLSGNNWSDKICDESDFSLDSLIVRNQDDLKPSADKELFQADNGEWVHDPDDNDFTGFSRFISVDCDQAAGDPEVINVTSSVTWEARGQDEEISVQEKLYNWFPDPGTSTNNG